MAYHTDKSPLQTLNEEYNELKKQNKKLKEFISEIFEYGCDPKISNCKSEFPKPICGNCTWGIYRFRYERNFK